MMKHRVIINVAKDDGETVSSVDVVEVMED